MLWLVEVGFRAFRVRVCELNLRQGSSIENFDLALSVSPPWSPRGGWQPQPTPFAGRWGSGTPLKGCYGFGVDGLELSIQDSASRLRWLHHQSPELVCRKPSP